MLKTFLLFLWKTWFLSTLIVDKVRSFFWSFKKVFFITKAFRGKLWARGWVYFGEWFLLKNFVLLKKRFRNYLYESNFWINLFQLVWRFGSAKLLKGVYFVNTWQFQGSPLIYSFLPSSVHHNFKKLLFFQQKMAVFYHKNTQMNSCPHRSSVVRKFLVEIPNGNLLEKF